MLKFAKLAAVVALSACALTLTGCEDPKATSAKGTEITFSILSVEKSQKLDKLWQPILADMEKQTGLKVKPFYSSSYTALIESMRFNQVQAGFFSSSSGLEAVKRAQAEVFAHNTNPDGTDGYTSVVIVPKDSKLTVADLLKCDHKLNFGMGDVKSASGTIVPKAFLFLPAKVDTNNCFKTVKSGSHGVNIESVAAGVLDAATANSDALNELKDTPEGQAKLDKIKIIWQSPMIPKGVIVYRKDLDPAAKEKIRSFFLSYGSGTGPEADRQRANLRAFQWGPMRPSDDSYLLPARLMEARVALQEAEIANDTKAAATAQAEINAIEKQQAALAAPTAPADAPAAQ
jgi:phosphonate transport system substrate-binding protein